MLPKSFGICDAVALALPGTPAFHRVDIFVHSMVLQKPLALTAVSAQHSSLGVEYRADVDPEVRTDFTAQRIFPFNCVAIIQVRNRLERPRVSAVGEEIRGW